MQNYHLEQFNQEVSVTYRGESYSVRDNGSICRLHRNGYRKRPLDDYWTYGTPCDRDGYMKICSLGVHRIVATAFHGVQPGDEYVVDHIDTNRRNNSPENLRWVTRLDNILKNPKTLRRIENKWGSIEGLLKDPNPAEITDPIINRPWMRQALIESTSEEESTIESLTPFALQRNWKTPSEFPMCPEEICESPLNNYASRLESGVIYSRNRYGESIVVIAEFSKDGSCLSVLCKIASEIKNYALSKVTFEEGKFIHASGGTFFTCEGAEKSHYQVIGLPWEEPVGYEGCIDDYC